MLGLSAVAYPANFVLKDNSVTVGKLAGMRGANFLVNVAGSIREIPVSKVSTIILNDADSTGLGQPTTSTSTQKDGTSTITDPIVPVVSAFSQTVEGFRV